MFHYVVCCFEKGCLCTPHPVDEKVCQGNESKNVLVLMIANVSL